MSSDNQAEANHRHDALTLAAYDGKRNVTVWHPSVCLSNFFLTLIERAVHTQRDSPGGSMRRGQRTFRPNILVGITTDTTLYNPSVTDTYMALIVYSKNLEQGRDRVSHFRALKLSSVKRYIRSN